MKYADIKTLTDEELSEKIVSEKDSLEKLKFAHAISQIENPMTIRASRKTIARLQTELSARKNKAN